MFVQRLWQYNYPTSIFANSFSTSVHPWVTGGEYDRNFQSEKDETRDGLNDEGV